MPTDIKYAFYKLQPITRWLLMPILAASQSRLYMRVIKIGRDEDLGSCKSNASVASRQTIENLISSIS
jgi:hypothetical protein